MNTQTNLELQEYNNKLTGYVGMLYYQYCNLCVKAEPVSLLSLMVPSPDGIEQIEKAAQVVLGEDKYSLLIIPYFRNRVMPITKALKLTHPEFKVEFFDKSTREPANVPDDLEKHLYMKITMPPVDKDRRDLLKDTANALYHKAETNIETNAKSYSGRILALSSGEDEKTIDFVKKEVEKYRTDNLDRIAALRKDKFKEVDEAYEKYMKEHSAEADASKQQNFDVAFGSKDNNDKSADESVGKSLKL